MKKQFACAMVVILVLGGTLPVMRPASSRSVSAYAPPTPVPSTLIPPLADSDEEGQPPSTLPDPVGLPPEEERTRVRQAAHAVLDEYSEKQELLHQMVVTEIKLEGEWAYAVAQPQAGSGNPLHLSAHRTTNGVWQVQIDGKSPGELQSLTEGWEFYSNEKMAFSILYPDGWFVHEVERSPDVGALIDFTPVPVREPGQVVPSLWIEVISNPATLKLDDWIQLHALQGLSAQIRSSVTIRPYRLRNIQGYEVTGLPGVYHNLQYFFATSEQVYRVTISPYDPEIHGFENMLSDILQLRDAMLLTLDIQD